MQHKQCAKTNILEVMITELSTVNGTPSASTSLRISGINISGGILVRPPLGFEVSTNSVNFSSTFVVGRQGGIAAKAVYIRLASSSPVGLYAGYLIFTSAGAADL